ncbi:hypothetical protein CBL_07161 [Carabus blaptoides fortunei]
MKKTIDSYFFPTAARPNKNSKVVSPRSIQSTDLVNIENKVAGTSKLFSEQQTCKDKRHYNKNWEQKYTWLEYNEEKGGAFCKLCRNYKKNDANILQKTSGVFITEPFRSFRKALGKNGKLEKHEHSSAHTISVQMETVRRQAIKKPIHTQLIQESEKEVNLNRKCLKTLLRGLYFLVKEEVAHTTKYKSLIENILDKLSNEFKIWREAHSDRSNYSSKKTASELLICIGEVLRDEMKKTLRDKKVVEGNVVKEKFLNLIKIPDGRAETIAEAIDKELTSLNLKYENLIAFGFDGAANMAGNINGVRRKLSEKANKDVLYMHCRAHILSLAAASCRNKNQKVKRFFHVVKDIYKLFSKSPKKENILHEIQAIIGDPILKIPECIEKRKFHHHLLCYKRNSQFTFLPKQYLTKKDLNLGNIITLVTTTKLHLESIGVQCEHIDSVLRKNIRCKIKEIKSEVHLMDDESMNKTLTDMKQYCKIVIQEIDHRFSDKSLETIVFASRFESYQSFLELKDAELKKFCDNFPILNYESLLADLKSFNYFIKTMLDEGTYKADEKVLTKILEADVGYCELQKLCEILLVIPVTTASVERSFSSMNRILNKARNRMLPETLMHCMLISIEGPEIPTEELLDKVVDLYAAKKPRRIRFL